MNEFYRPEGMTEVIGDYTPQTLEQAILTGKILESRAVMCDKDHNLTVSLGCMRGFIPREKAALGISDGSVRDIAVLSRVNKQVCFKVERITRTENGHMAMLSRVAAQEEALDYMLGCYRPGDIIDAKITHLEPFGAFADIGCGVVGLINIENISVSRISHPADRFSVGQKIKAVIKDIDYAQKRFTLSHKELLGTWLENSELFTVGQTVCGIIRSVEDYGVFVELTPNLAGLAEFRSDVAAGQSATVYIKSIIPEKMKVKLSIIDSADCSVQPAEIKYFIQSSHIDVFRYSPQDCRKTVKTVFGY